MTDLERLRAKIQGLPDGYFRPEYIISLIDEIAVQSPQTKENECDTENDRKGVT